MCFQSFRCIRTFQATLKIVAVWHISLKFDIYRCGTPKKKWCTNLVTLIMKSHLFGVQTCFRWLTLVRSGFYVVLYQLFFLVHFSHWSSSVMDHLRPCIFLISSCALHISFTIQTLFWGERTVNILCFWGYVDV